MAYDRTREIALFGVLSTLLSYAFLTSVVSADDWPPTPGSQIGRKASSPEGGLTSLTDPALYSGGNKN